MTVLIWALGIYLAIGIISLCVAIAVDKEMPDLQEVATCITLWPLMWLLLIFFKIYGFKL